MGFWQGLGEAPLPPQPPLTAEETSFVGGWRCRQRWTRDPEPCGSLGAERHRACLAEGGSSSPAAKRQPSCPPAPTPPLAGAHAPGSTVNHDNTAKVRRILNSTALPTQRIPALLPTLQPHTYVHACPTLSHPDSSKQQRFITSNEQGAAGPWRPHPQNARNPAPIVH